MAAAPDEARLAALEQACIARRVLLSTCVASDSAESSAAIVNGLAEGAPHADEMRSLLRRRDDLAMSILQTQRRLADVQEERQRVITRIQGMWSLTDLRKEAASTHSTDSPAPDATPVAEHSAKLRLLHGTLVGIAMNAPKPWWQDEQLAQLILSDP
ncbi:hypothetical protein MCUN1_001407 [Malassezia cuniculi]|uniref:Centromere protein H C-terminal domain-containing protein n=1 Tax=Malassezia cuniculi TaxID=948313 RepID=A0AAF0EQ75_9BASI|nr:hypothetical protein MCUN1_001407 [Malassezia cuniculi]